MQRNQPMKGNRNKLMTVNDYAKANMTLIEYSTWLLHGINSHIRIDIVKHKQNNILNDTEGGLNVD
jgi:hypothetical protein